MPAHKKSGEKMLLLRKTACWGSRPPLDSYISRYSDLLSIYLSVVYLVIKVVRVSRTNRHFFHCTTDIQPTAGRCMPVPSNIFPPPYLFVRFSSLCAHDFFLFQRVSYQNSMSMSTVGMLNPVWAIKPNRRRDDISMRPQLVQKLENIRELKL